MSLWLKKRLRSLGEKKSNCKLNPYSGQGLEKLAKLIKTECLAARGGFPTAVSSFVANSRLGWPGNNDAVCPKASAKKKLWHALKKASRKPQPNKVHVPDPNPQSPVECPQQHCHDRHLNEISVEVAGANAAPEKQVDVSDISEKVGVRVAPETAAATRRVYPLYRQLFTLIVVVIMSISVVLEAKKVAVGTAAIVFFLFQVIFKRRPETCSAAQSFTLNPVLYSPVASLLFIIRCVSLCKKSTNSSQGDSLPYGGLGLSGPRKQSLPCLDVVPISTSSTDVDRHIETAHQGLAALPPFAESIQTYPVFPERNIQGGKISKPKLLRKSVFHRCASAPTSPRVRNETIPWAKVMSSSACPASEPFALSCMGRINLPCSDSNLQRESRQKKDQALKFCHSKSFPGAVTVEECDDHKIGTVDKKCGYALGTTLLIVVLCGLMAGRLYSLVLAISWCFFIKIVGFAWQNIARCHQYGINVSKERN